MIALIHNKLYEQQDINRLNVQEYIEQLGAHLLSIYNDHQKDVRFEVNAHDVLLDIDTAIPVGLILTELIRSEENTSELQSLMRITYAVFCLTNNTNTNK